MSHWHTGELCGHLSPPRQSPRRAQDELRCMFYLKDKVRLHREENIFFYLFMFLIQQRLAVCLWGARRFPGEENGDF